MTTNIPTRPEGWKFAGRAGKFHVWNAGKNDYYVTNGSGGEIVGWRNQFGLAHAVARQMNSSPVPPYKETPAEAAIREYFEAQKP